MLTPSELRPSIMVVTHLLVSRGGILSGQMAYAKISEGLYNPSDIESSA